jgi:hypothetical protein
MFEDRVNSSKITNTFTTAGKKVPGEFGFKRYLYPSLPPLLPSFPI